MSEVISDFRKKNISTSSDQMYCKYKLCLVHLCSALRAVRHARLARTVYFFAARKYSSCPKYPKNNKKIYIYLKKKLNELLMKASRSQFSEIYQCWLVRLIYIFLTSLSQYFFCRLQFIRARRTLFYRTCQTR